MDPLVKNYVLGVIYTSQNIFYFFFKKTWCYKVSKHVLDFRLFTFWYFASIWTQKSCHARCTPCMICQKTRTDVRTRTDGRTSMFKRLPHKSFSGKFFQHTCSGKPMSCRKSGLNTYFYVNVFKNVGLVSHLENRVLFYYYYGPFVSDLPNPNFVTKDQPLTLTLA